MTAKKTPTPPADEGEHDDSEYEALRYLTAASVLTREINLTLHDMECHDGMALDFGAADRLRAYVTSLDAITESVFELALDAPTKPLKAVG